MTESDVAVPTTTLPWSVDTVRFKDSNRLIGRKKIWSKESWERQIEGALLEMIWTSMQQSKEHKNRGRRQSRNKGGELQQTNGNKERT